MLRQFVWSLLVVSLCVRGAAAQTVWPGEEWETAAPASQGMDAEGLEKARGWLESHNSKSGVVIRHGRIVAEWYFGDADRQSKFAAYSTSKSLSSMATGLAIADGTLALDHTVGRYIPDASPEGKRAVTVKQLLSMTSGVHNDPEIGQREDLFSYALRTVAMDHE
ncbi:MAG TPA: serine hydrolase domain-containing protein, partial [Planctomycetaceae bacterium]|nr:serine hydrolase domain-containing protein [Planctomycetaceae bacterium]